VYPEFFDETLRDGEQQAGLHLPFPLKRRLAAAIARTGVARIDLMPVADAEERELARTLVGDGLAGLLSAATPVGRRFVEEAAACGLRHLVVFYACSDRLLFLRDPLLRVDPAFADATVDDDIPLTVLEGARDRMLESTLDTIEYARGLGLGVDFAAEDASRADECFLATALAEIGPRVGRFLLCDTVGVLEPARTRSWIRTLRDRAPRVELGVHFHDDRGLALANTMAALEAGATMVSGTFRGIGERAGNVALEAVMHEFDEREGLRSGDAASAVDEVLRLLDEADLRPARPGSPEARRHLSGMHVQALLRDPASYCADAEAPFEVWYGKLSGASNMQYLFERVLDRPLPAGEYARLSALVKEKARLAARDFRGEEILEWIARGEFDARA
jgi:benzylmalate synthase